MNEHAASAYLYFLLSYPDLRALQTQSGGWTITRAATEPPMIMKW